MDTRLPVHICGHRIDGTSHVCVFYESDAERIAAVRPYVAEGLRHGEKVVTFLPHPDHAALEAIHAPAIASGQLEVHTPEATYLAQGRFDPDDMYERAGAMLASLRHSPWRRLRATGDMDWATRTDTDPRDLLSYEARIWYLTVKHECTLACLFDLRTMTPEMLRFILSTHSHVIARGRLFANPHYMDAVVTLAAENDRAMARAPANGIQAALMQDRQRQLDQWVDGAVQVLRGETRDSGLAG